MGNIIDLTGQRFGMLTVIKQGNRYPVGKRRAMKTYWVCQCDCGTIKEICGDNLRSGLSNSCGCQVRQSTIKRSTKHGFSKRGNKRSRIYKIWAKMKSRCLNQNDPHYAEYGGRGIHVVNEWQQFEPFKDWALSNGYSDSLTIDRIDVNGDYSPENCRWVTQEVQTNNTRRNVMIKLENIVHSMSEWCKELNLDYYTVRARRNLGWDDYSALFTPKCFERKSI